MKNSSDPAFRLTPERWRRIDQLLEEALELDPARQESFLDQACAGDPDLRRELVALLAEHHRSTGVLDRPAVDAVAADLVEDDVPSLVGSQLSSYQILALLGSGGMGAVYRALDTRLDRPVALKILPQALIHDDDRMRRFTTEAKTASSLNHPNICTVHELGDCRGIRFISMEYIDGQTLAEIAGKRSVSPSEIVEIGIQVADALDAAHGKGIIHRDIKPGNLMMTARGLVKVLDFGIAKLKRPARTGVETTARTLTQEGVILGTVDYMSPEQVLGQDLDERTDIFSLGAVLYELATGRRPFSGITATETMDRILHAQPASFERLGGHLPSELERIVRRCLEKDPKRRYQSASELLAELKDFRQRILPGVARPLIRVSPRTALAAIVLIAALAVLTALWLKRDVETPLAVVPLTSYAGFERDPSFSPDGSQVAFSWASKPEAPYDSDIYIKQVGSEARFRLTTDEAPDTDPAWSPDGRWIAFMRQRSSMDYSLILRSPLGGTERSLAEVRLPAGFCWDQNIAWHPKAKWLVVPDRHIESGPPALFAISLETGERHRLTSPPAGSMGDAGPAFSPDGDTLGFSRYASSGISSVYLLSVSDRLAPIGEPRRITFNYRSFSPEWTPDGNEIVYVSGVTHATSLWRLDAKQPGDPRPLAVPGHPYAPAFSRQGTLAFSQLLLDVNIWKTDSSLSKARAPAPVNLISSTYVDHTPRFSPDGRHIAFASYRSGSPEIWVCDREGSPAVQLTWFGGPGTDLPAWSPDGKQIAFASSGEGSSDIYVINAQGGRPQRLTSEPSDEGSPCYSRDGKWIYFSSNRTGQDQIWKMPAEHEGGEKIRVTRRGGRSPALSPEGNFIYYVKDPGDEFGSLWRTPVDGGAERTILPAVHANAYAILRQGIYFIPRPDPAWSINFLNFETGAITRFLTLPRLPGWGFDVSRDGQEILYTQCDSQGDDLMLIEDFR